MTGRRALESFTALVLVIAACVPAISNAAEVRPIIKAGFGLGGDTVVTVGVNGSSGSSTRSIKANQGVFVGGGASILTDSKELEARFRFRTSSTSSPRRTAISIGTVLPLDALVFYRMPNVRLGGGLTYHLSPTLSGSGAASGLNAKYDDALGFVLQGDYVLKNRFNFGLRYTSVEYKRTSFQTNPLIVATTPAANPKTNGLGFVFSMSF